jgi:hypothetical protein
MLRQLTVIALGIVLFFARSARAGNDDSCDIGVTPAATLLLPYFEVDFFSPAGEGLTTLFTITNVSALPQIAHVTLWTDWAFAALTFNIFLTPYGTQSVNLFDVFTRGVLAPGAAYFVALPILDPRQKNPNFDVTPGSPHNVTVSCSTPPPTLPSVILGDLQQIFTLGRAGATIGAGCGSSRLGGVHPHAVGYVTVDVVNTCSSTLPAPEYFASEVLFDNVLIGDYENVDGKQSTGGFATGSPMVHIRAVPEGGPAGSNPGTSLPFTFYDRYTATTPQTLPRSIDRRQPLPSTFAARWIQGGSANFATSYAIWREGLTGPRSYVCTHNVPAANSAIPLDFGGEIVRFDEHENATVSVFECPNECPDPFTLPAASSTSTSSYQFPGSGDPSGWMYLNLSVANVAAYSSRSRASQNWVSVVMRAEGRYAVLFDAAQLGNGCSPPPVPHTTIGPAGGAPVCPEGATGCTPGVAPYTGTNVNPPP